MTDRQPTVGSAATSAALLERGAIVGERYEVERWLGEGTFANVYRAQDLEVPEHAVCLKIHKAPAAGAEAVRQALRELQLIASVFHPSIVQLKDHGWHRGHLWFVMPLYRGETLAARLRRGPLTRRAARETFEPLAEALATMHRFGVRHQDIKPDNIFLAQLHPEAESPLPVLLDLGLGVKDAELVLAGTPGYLAPEVAAQFAGVPDPAPIGPKADVFALALTLREALDPGPDDAPPAELAAFLEQRSSTAPPAPSRRDLRDLQAHFNRWLNVSPDARPTAEELRRELAVLTRRQELRARRRELARWLVPTVLGSITLFATTTVVLSQEAELQRLEAQHERLSASQARERALTIQTSLEEEKGKRRLLEEEFRSSKLTKAELEQRLILLQEELTRQVQVTEQLTVELCKQRGAVDCPVEGSGGAAHEHEVGTDLERRIDGVPLGVK